MKKALITGITGQDGSYLAEFLLNKGYEVHGIIRRSSSFNTKRIDHIFSKLKLYYGDVTDSLSLDNIIYNVKPDEIYHLSAQSHVKVSFEMPEYTGQVDAIGTLKILECAKRHVPKCKIYNACTSELYGKSKEIPQTEETPFYPRSPYGVAKLYSFWIAKNYRESYNMFVSNGILFNHESERRSETFVSRKITKGLSRVVSGKQDFIELGNLYAKRDWGYAPEYVEGMWMMLQHNIPDDFVLATNESHTIKDFIEISINVINDYIINNNLNHLPIELEWKGTGINEVGFCKLRNRPIIKINSKYYRPSEVDYLLGDYSKAKKILGWEPKTKFKDLVYKMMIYDLKNI